MEYKITSRNKLRRIPKRGRYERPVIYSIIDEALVCHIGFVMEGQPFVIPTLHARKGDQLYLHGAPAGRMLNHILAGYEVCATMTIVDGLVLAKSIFHHSINYRSVVVFGRGRLVETDSEKLLALELLTERILPGRWKDARPPDQKELDATAVVCIDIETASAKIRNGPPTEEDLAWPVWTGILPIYQAAGTPLPADSTKNTEPLPTYLLDYIQKSRR